MFTVLAIFVVLGSILLLGAVIGAAMVIGGQRPRAETAASPASGAAAACEDPAAGSDLRRAA